MCACHQHFQRKDLRSPLVLVRIKIILQILIIFPRFICLLILTCGSFLFWLGIVVLPCPNRRFITQHLEMCEMPFDPEGFYLCFKFYNFVISASQSKKEVRRFIDDIGMDGLFVIRMLTLHTGGRKGSLIRD